MRKATLDDVIYLSIYELNKLGKLTPGSSVDLAWFRGDVLLERTKIFIEENHLEMVGGKVALDFTSCHFGSLRAWLLCPQCNRRCGVLYGTDFVCRKCIGLPYRSQHANVRERLRRKLNKFKETTFGNFSPWVKPKHQHGRTYLGNLDKWCYLTEVENEMDRAILASIRTQMNM